MKELNLDQLSYYGERWLKEFVTNCTYEDRDGNLNMDSEKIHRLMGDFGRKQMIGIIRSFGVIVKGLTHFDFHELPFQEKRILYIIGYTTLTYPVSGFMGAREDFTEIIQEHPILMKVVDFVNE